MQNARLDKAQAGIKTARRNINNLIYADDTTLMAESKDPGGSVVKNPPAEDMGRIPDLGISHMPRSH